jgi:tRNA (cmo5U34)-methyltransferase
VSQFHFDPARYRELMAADVPAYDELQSRIAVANEGIAAGRILDLGAGTGETSNAVRVKHADARIIAVDESPGMLARITDANVEPHVGRLQDPLPPGPFDLVVSALAVHHLDPAEKRDLFMRVHDALRPGGRFVLGDVVIAEIQVAPLSDGYDKPDRAHDQIEWLRAAGFDADLLWECDDLALLRADRA